MALANATYATARHSLIPNFLIINSQFSIINSFQSALQSQRGCVSGRKMLRHFNHTSTNPVRIETMIKANRFGMKIKAII